MFRHYRIIGCLTAAVLLWLACPIEPASAQYFGRNKVQYDDFDFKRFSSEHFDVYYYPPTDQAAQDMARMAERWYRRHSVTFRREFTERKPLIFYANDADFQQTNVVGGFIGQGTGGVTESLKERVTMPLTGLYSENNHVLGHELVHSFQYDIALNRPDDAGRFSLGNLPLWLIEGMAEYLSVGREDTHTAMWLRDAAMRDDLPTIAQLTSSLRYFPYRYGQAYMAYIGGKYGDLAVADLYIRGGQVSLDSAFVYVLGITADSLSSEWQEVVKQTYLPLMEGRTDPRAVGRLVLSEETGAGTMNLAPAISPDGRYIAFLSELDLFHINLFIADAQTGRIINKLHETNSDPHYDAMRFINSSGTWSPDGNRFAFVTFVEGDNEISVWNVSSGKIERRIAVEGVTAILNPAWSPDGRYIAFSGMEGGISDLYILDLETSGVRQLTNDRYADLQPTWSPDGASIAFTTDRGPQGSNFENLDFANVRIGIIDVASGDVTYVMPFGNAIHHNPRYSPDGQSLYFISDHDGFKDVYRYDLAAGSTYRITNIKTGVSGITAMSPAMSVAVQSGRMAFSVFSNNEYTVHTLEPDELTGEPAVAEEGVAVAGILPPARAVNEGLVANYLGDPLGGLPPAPDFTPSDYRAKLTLDAVAPPTVGLQVGGPFGAQVGGGVGFFFSDMLGNQNLAIAVQAQGTFKDIGGQVSYLNAANRINHGATVGHIPYLFGGARFGIDPRTGVRVIDQIYQRLFIDQAIGFAQYPFSMTRRVEVNAGFIRYGFDFDIERYFIDPFGRIIDRDRQDLEAPDPVYFVQAAAAYVGDYSNFGFTSPIQGGRYRFQVAPQVGTDSYVTVLGDYRRYFFWQPLTLAVRGLHIGNYGADPDDIFANEYLGYEYYPGYIRGYDFRSFDPEDLSSMDDDVSEIDRLQGTRIAVASIELRIPLFGTEQFGLINFPYLPTEVSLFTDAGVAWTEDEAPVLKFKRRTNERVPVVSSGISFRMNLLGFIVIEPYLAYPFQRPDKGWIWGFQFAPGW